MPSQARLSLEVRLRKLKRLHKEKLKIEEGFGIEDEKQKWFQYITPLLEAIKEDFPQFSSLGRSALLRKLGITKDPKALNICFSSSEDEEYNNYGDKDDSNDEDIDCFKKSKFDKETDENYDDDDDDNAIY